MNTQRPNIIFLTWHDAGDWFGCYGYDTVRTPNVDRLAKQGVRFSNFFSMCAICSPSRASMMTGLHIQNHGAVTLTNDPFAPSIRPEAPHLASTLKDLGYHTALFGVQHECAHEYVDAIMRVDEKIATDPWPNGDLLAHHVREWLAERPRSSQPFYAQIGTYDSHLGRFYKQVPARKDEPYPPVQDTEAGLFMPPYLQDNEAGRETVATLQGLLHRGDKVIGAVLDGLAEEGLEDNTIVIMAVDHGVGLDRAKGMCHDAGTRVAWIMRWPGHLPESKVVDALASQVDVLPTLSELLGVQLAPRMDGISHAGRITGDSAPRENLVVHSQMVERARSIRTSQFRYIRNFGRPTLERNQKGDCSRKFGEQDPIEATGPIEELIVELYDMRKDPFELNNLAGLPEYKEEQDRLDTQLWDFLLDHDDFVLHRTVRDEWDLRTRRDLEAHCARTGRPLQPAVGPMVNVIDKATASGKLP